MAVAGLLLTVCALLLLLLHWDVLLEASVSGVLTWRPDRHRPGDRPFCSAVPPRRITTALAIACSTRHLGIAVLVAASLPRTANGSHHCRLFLTSAVISIPYLRWRRAAVSH